LIGSNDALSTKTRVFILKPNYILSRAILSKVVRVKFVLHRSAGEPPGGLNRV
jgi:hypothetical protein